MYRLLPIVLLLGACSGVRDVPAVHTPETQTSAAYRELKTLTGPSARRGALLITAETVELRLQRGVSSVPFLSLPRGTYQLGCWKPPPPEEERVSTAQWWIFSNDSTAVALQLAASGISAWFWDEQRNCQVRVPIERGVDFDETPSRFYKADDAQIAYRRNYAGALYDADGPTREGAALADVLYGIEGDETLIAEADVIAIQTADGLQVLRETFDVDPDWLCYNSEVTVFEERDHGLYAIAAFETSGSASSCDKTSTELRYTSTILQWRPKQRRFVRAFRIEERSRALMPAGEDTVVRVERSREIEGGTLTTLSTKSLLHQQGPKDQCSDLDLGTGVCLAQQECWSWRATNLLGARYSFVGRDGVLLELGEARTTLSENGDYCDGRKGP